jgi:hypothetical protein
MLSAAVYVRLTPQEKPDVTSSSHVSIAVPSVMLATSRRDCVWNATTPPVEPAAPSCHAIAVDESRMSDHAPVGACVKLKTLLPVASAPARFMKNSEMYVRLP